MTQRGYEIDRDVVGVTKREREVLDLMAQGLVFSEIGKRIGLSKQRVGQIAQALTKKGLLIHSERGYGIPMSMIRPGETEDVNS